MPDINGRVLFENNLKENEADYERGTCGFSFWVCRLVLGKGSWNANCIAITAFPLMNNNYGSNSGNAQTEFYCLQKPIISFSAKNEKKKGYR